MCLIRPYTSDTNVEYFKCWKLIIDNVTLEKYQLYNYVFTFNIVTDVLYSYMYGDVDEYSYPYTNMLWRFYDYVIFSHELWLFILDSVINPYIL